MNFIYSIVHSPTIGNPNKRALGKLKCYESIHEISVNLHLQPNTILETNQKIFLMPLVDCLAHFLRFKIMCKEYCYLHIGQIQYFLAFPKIYIYHRYICIYIYIYIYICVIYICLYNIYIYIYICVCVYILNKNSPKIEP